MITILCAIAQKISVCKSAKYLSAHIDRDLNFKHHIQFLQNKLSRNVEILFKVKTFLAKNVLFQPKGWPTGQLRSTSRSRAIK